jgi:hypothetical protein
MCTCRARHEKQKQGGWEKMADKRVIKIQLPELDRSKGQDALTSGKCRLTLETDKAYNGGVDCTAQVSWIDERGFASHVLGIGGGGDFSRTYAKVKGIATQKRIDTMHAQTFTPEFIESIKAEVRSFYALEAAKRASEAA